MTASAGWRAEPYEPKYRTEWDSVVASSRVPHFLFYRDYMEYHSDRFEDASLLLIEDGKRTAILPANRSGDVIASHGGLTFGGLLADSSITSNSMLGAFAAAVSHYRVTGARKLLYAPAPHIYHAVPADEDLYALFRLGAVLVRRDLSSALAPASHPRPSKGRRASVKQSGSEGLTIGIDADYGTYMRLLEETLRERHNVTPTHTSDELTVLANRFPENIRLFTARDGDKLLAGVVIYETPVVAHAQYMAASPEGRGRAALDAVVDRLVRDTYRSKPWFDFGISTTHDGTVLNVQLARYKESYGARGVAYDRYVLAL